MARQARIIVFGEKASAAERQVSELQQEGFEVAVSNDATSLQSVTGPPDLLLMDSTERPDFLADLRACRRAFPAEATPILILGVADPDRAVAAIDAGATDAVSDAVTGPMLGAHVRRVLRAGQHLRELVDEQRQKAKRESLALAAADVAVPLGRMIDELEAVMGRTPVDQRLDELLELTGRAVDAVDRLRQMAAGSHEDAAVASAMKPVDRR